MACGNCCCNGCSHKPWDSRIGGGEFQPTRHYCCSCIPLGICVTVTGDDGYVIRTVNLWRHCTVTPDGEDLILYSGTFTINGESVNLWFRFKVDEEYGLGYFCVDGDGINQDCVLIDHDEQHDDPYCDDPCDMRTEFCCTFAAEFTFDTSYVGNGENSTITVATEKADLLSLAKAPGFCGGCQCICRCMCFTVAVTPLLGAGSSSIEEVCADVSTGDVGYCESRQTTSVSWAHSLGYSVSLAGRGPTVLNDFILTSGVEASGESDDVDCPDQTTHVLEPDDYGELDAIYEFATNISRASTEFTWYGYVQVGADAEVTVEVWDWIATEWDFVGTILGRDSSTIRLQAFDLDDEHTGTGVNEGLIRVRFTSSTAMTLATDWIRFTTPDCCMLRLHVPPGEFAADPEPVPIEFGNECPNPSATWDLFNLAGDAVFVSLRCLLCETCSGVGSACCNATIPEVLTATIVVDGCDACDTAEVTLIFDESDSSWSGTGVWCGESIALHLSCEGNVETPVFRLISETARACFIGAEGGITQDEVTCDPFEVIFSGSLIGLGCCPNGPEFASPTATVIIAA